MGNFKIRTKMNKRIPEYPVHELLLNRWSPRAMSGEPVSHNELMSLFEAAKWAPSSYNNQPWRFIYVTKDMEQWQQFFDLLDPFNENWAGPAWALIVVLSRKNFEYNDEPSKTCSYDVGAACQNLALQGHASNLVIHAIEGFDYDKARSELSISDEYNIEVMFSVGKPGKVEDLPESLQKREIYSDRKKLQELVFKGKMP